MKSYEDSLTNKNELKNSNSRWDGSPCPPRAGTPAPRIQLTAVLPAIEAHAWSSEGEVCGFIYPDHYVPLPNLSSAQDHFYADPHALARALARFGEPAIIFHTHPNGNLNLSTEDQTLWYYRNSTMMVGCMFGGRLRWKIYGNRGD